MTFEASGTSSVTPSLLIFGSLGGIPSPELLDMARSKIQSQPELTELRNAICNLSTFWQNLVKSDSNLDRIPGYQFLRSLKTWVVGNDPLPTIPPKVSNMGQIFITFILHIVQYVWYIESLGRQDAHQWAVMGLKTGGIHGLCIGFISAVAIATSKGQDEIALNAAHCLRLAICIAAHVDKDRMYATSPERTICLSVRWRDQDVSKNRSISDLWSEFPDVS